MAFSSSPPGPSSGTGGSVTSAAGHLVLRLRGERIPLGFAREGPTVFLIASARSSLWPIDLLRAGGAELELPDGPIRGAVTLVSDPREIARIQELFRRRYGESDYRRYYSKPARTLRVDGAASVAGDSSERYFRWLEAEFDAIAADYDHHILDNRINRLLRDRSVRRLRELFPRREPLIEIGCGSGTETLQLLADGHEMLAVDISERMLEVVRGKAAAAGVGERLRTLRCRAGDLEAHLAEIGPGSFLGGYSTYGALNCEPDLTPVVRGIASCLPPGSRFLAGIYNRWCLFELLGYGLTLQPGRAIGRRHRPVPVGASRFCIDTYAYSVADVVTAFKPSFDPTGLTGVPVLLPPSDLQRYTERFTRHFTTLARWDEVAGRRFPFTHLGDHFLIDLVRRP